MTAEYVTVTWKRPARPATFPEEAYEAVPAGPEWSTSPGRVMGRRCRQGSTQNGYCENPAVAALDRHHYGTKRPLWYAYCGDHLYGRWLEGERVMGWRVRPDWDDSADSPPEPRVVESR